MIRNLFKVLFFPLLGRIKSKPAVPAPPPFRSNKVHVFEGTFASEVEATDYGLGLTTPSLIDDLGAPTLGPNDIEILFGQARIAAARSMLQWSKPMPASSSNTCFLVSDRGDISSSAIKDRVTYLGLCDIT